ncbi:uncharacterized protein EV154DRAFT_487293 [Mucor mucedo]|uniref:uncharacterized protein n=1 Tax=Mucor mucedo TaxID=29922 RepID=UPI0022205CBF|nr:uncharacterized protein EV154DRAFT_487293 [Mucor mucedo]KAI7873314.1 hypothetical protein EV154DRAFT_487293 [Mucor mucedo]
MSSAEMNIDPHVLLSLLYIHSSNSIFFCDPNLHFISIPNTRYLVLSYRIRRWAASGQPICGLWGTEGHVTKKCSRKTERFQSVERVKKATPTVTSTSSATVQYVSWVCPVQSSHSGLPRCAQISAWANCRLRGIQIIGSGYRFWYESSAHSDRWQNPTAVNSVCSMAISLFLSDLHHEFVDIQGPPAKKKRLSVAVGVVQFNDKGVATVKITNLDTTVI